MRIQEPDFIMEPVDETSDLFNLVFYKRVKKRSTGNYELELGTPLYGLTLYSALQRIAKHRVIKKYEEANISLKQFLKEYQLAYKEIVKLCRECLPENFDTGD